MLAKSIGFNRKCWILNPGSERLPLVDLRLPVVPSTLANADAGVVTAKMADASVQTVPSDYNPVWGGGCPAAPQTLWPGLP